MIELLCSGGLFDDILLVEVLLLGSFNGCCSLFVECFGNVLGCEVWN